MKRRITSIQIFRLCLCFLMCVVSLQSRASHSAGVDLTYVNTGGNNYLFTLKFYRDCAGIPAPSSVNLTINSNSCGVFTNAQLIPLPGTGQEITQACSTVTTTCMGGTYAGIQEWVYQTTVSLSNCSDWTFSIDECCRNAAITTVNNPGGSNIYVAATLNNLNGQNNSTYFSNIPISFICIGQDFSFNHGAIDSDGDSLYYELVDPLNTGAVPITYNAPYTFLSPVTSSPALSLDHDNGDIFMHPLQQEISVMAVRVSEYRNGVLIGTVTRDMQIYTVSCNNQLPTATGIDGTNNFSLSSCILGQLCFDIFTNDADLGQQLSISWNQGIPGATFTSSGGSHPTGTFCWTPQPGDIRPQPYTFTITVKDNACPSNGFQTYSYSLIVSQLTVNITGRLETICHDGHDGIATANAISGIGPFTYTWAPAEQHTKTITRLVPGTYTVTVVDSSGCAGVQTITITEPPQVVVTTTHTDLDCSGNLGTANAAGAGGYGPYTYIWNGDSTMMSAGINNLSPGFYKVQVRDSHNCPAFDSLIVAGSSAVTATSSQTNTSCDEASNGSATITPSGGSGNYTYVWTPNVSSSDVANNLAAGIYVCIISDGSCTNAHTINIISDNLYPVVDLGPDLLPCAGDIVTLDAGSGFATYLWNDASGSNTQTIIATEDGNYAVEVTDANGCSNSDTMNITYQGCSRVGAVDAGVVEVYPNPTNGNFNLQIAGIDGEVNISIFDMQSKIVFTKTLNASTGLNTEIDTQLSKGIYLMKVKHSAQQNIIRLIVQ